MYLREEMHKGNLLPGSTINPTELSEHLGISKTPLRDALIRLESEGFVTILPRRGIQVNSLSLKDVENSYEVVGILEGGVIQEVFDRFNESHLRTMERLNNRMAKAVESEDFDGYYALNLQFHDVYLDLSENALLQQIVTPIKQRLYDFPRRGYLKEWELRNCDEHQQFVDFIRAGQREEAIHVMRDVHWSFQVQEKYIHKFYNLVAEEIQTEHIRRQAEA